MPVVFVLLFSTLAFANGNLDFYACGVGLAHPSVSQNHPGGTDTLVFEYEDLNAPPGHPSRFRGNQFTLQQGDGFATSEQPWSTEITRLTFALGTEAFGSEYFVELCYRTQAPPNNSQDGYYNFSSQIQIVQAILNGFRYSTQARLIGQLKMECDLKNAGSNTQRFDPSRFESDFIYLSNPFELNSGSAGIQFPINNAANQVPLGCKARLSFRELATTQRLHGLSIREIDTLSTLSKDTNENLY